MNQTENIRRHIGESISIRWGVSRGRDSYGYTTCSLRNGQGVKIAGCNGGGYDMRGTVIGHWIASTFKAELCALRPEDMPEQSHWQPEHARVCDGKCKAEAWARWEKAIESDGNATPEALAKLPEDCWECPTCGGPTRQSREGKRIDDGRSFPGLCFYDPNYDPGKAVVGKDCSNRSLGGQDGKTVEQLEAEGSSFGLERYQAFYRQTSHHATERHTIPTIDGACGLSSVEKILAAIGLRLDRTYNSSKLEIYTVREATPELVTA